MFFTLLTNTVVQIIQQIMLWDVTTETNMNDILMFVQCCIVSKHLGNIITNMEVDDLPIEFIIAIWPHLYTGFCRVHCSSPASSRYIPTRMLHPGSLKTVNCEFFL